MVNINKHKVNTIHNARVEIENVKKQSSSKPKRGRNAEHIILSSPEIIINAIIWTAIAIYGSYRVYDYSQFVDTSDDTSFKKGWSFLSNKRNSEDWEWETYRNFISKFSLYFLLHSFLSVILQISISSNKLLFRSLALFSAAVLTFELGVNFVVGIACMAAAYYTVAMVTKQMLCVWAASISLLAVTNNRDLMEPFLKFMTSSQNDLELENSDEYHCRSTMVYFAVSLNANRLISFTSDLLTSLSSSTCAYSSSTTSSCVSSDIGTTRSTRSTAVKSTTTTKTFTNKADVEASANFKVTYGIIDLLTYIFYIPVLFSGPLMNYDEFMQKMHQTRPSWSGRRVTSLFLRLCRVVAWMLFLDFSLHYAYFVSMVHNGHLLTSVDKWTLIGIGFTMGQFFMVKYIGIFGIPGIVASIDGLEYPSGPKCISRIYKYSDTWKYFDRGLYNFMQKYIYRAVGGADPSLSRRLLAACVSFLYVWFWHGGYTSLAWWSAINLAGILMEQLIRGMSDAAADFEEKYISLEWSRRIRAILAVPLLFTSTIAAIIFFTNTDNGLIFFYRLLDSVDSIVITSVGLYCHVQTSMQFSQWEHQRIQKKRV